MKTEWQRVRQRAIKAAESFEEFVALHIADDETRRQHTILLDEMILSRDALLKQTNDNTTTDQKE